MEKKKTKKAKLVMMRLKLNKLAVKNSCKV
jgi:hypothetical protein